MCSRIDIEFSGKYDKDVDYLKLFSVIQACLIEIVFEVCLKAATASVIQVAGIHTSATRAWFIQTQRFRSQCWTPQTVEKTQVQGEVCTYKDPQTNLDLQTNKFKANPWFMHIWNQTLTLTYTHIDTTNLTAVSYSFMYRRQLWFQPPWHDHKLT